MNSFYGLGILMFVLMVVSHFRKKSGWEKAARDYPALAQTWGLEFRTPAPRAIGKLRGFYRGYEVVIDPDDLCRITVRFATAPCVELRSYVHFKRPPSGLEAFRTGNSAFDGYFSDKYATAALVDSLQAAEGLTELIRPFRDARTVKSLAITPAGVECVFDYGRPPYIPKEALETFLPRLIEWARWFEVPGSEPVA
jgi:hypothetical protein